MLAEKILKELNNAPCPEMAIPEIKELCKQEIYKTENKKSGNGKIESYAKKIVKNAKYHGNRALQYATTVNGKQYFCDGHRILRLDNPISFEELPDDIPPLNYEKMWVNYPEREYTLDIDFKDAISAYKVAKAESDKKDNIVYSFGILDSDTFYLINAEYFTDFLKVDTDIRIFKDVGRFAPLIITNSVGHELLVLPVKPIEGKEYNIGVHNLNTGKYYG